MKRIKILITGGLGGIGIHLAETALKRGFDVRIFNRASRKAKQRAQNLNLKNAEIIYGDIVNYEDCLSIVQGVDAVCHLAALVPPQSEKNPVLTRQINVTGTENIIRAIRAADSGIHLIFASSTTLYGPRKEDSSVFTIDDPVNPTDIYTHTKVQCEEMIENSGLPHWTILRIAGTIHLYSRFSEYKKMFLINLKTRVEFVHIFDIVTAFINSILNEQCFQEKFIISGGIKNRMNYEEMMRKLFSLMWVPFPPEENFSKEPYYQDWYDSGESQRILHYQKRSIAELFEDRRKAQGFIGRFVLYFIGPLWHVCRWFERLWKSDK